MLSIMAQFGENATRKMLEIQCSPLNMACLIIVWHISFSATKRRI